MFNICNYKTLVNDLKCNQCSKILSVFPVHYSSSVGNICGRCISSVDWMISNAVVERAVAYESVAKFLIFPCSNFVHGCNAKLNYKEVLQHEQQCNFVINPCPLNIDCEQLSLKCNWQGADNAVPEHLRKNHEDIIQVGLPIFLMNVSESYIKIFLTTIDGEMFCILTKFAKELNKFYVIVMCCGTPPQPLCYRYQLAVGSADDLFLVLKKPETEAIGKVQNSINNHDKMIIIDVPSVQAMLNDPNALIHYRISITKKTKKEITAITGEVVKTPPASKPNPKELSKVESSTSSTKTVQSKPPCLLQPKGENSSNKPKINHFMEELECPVCYNLMAPPIFICPTGHSICNSCKLKLQLCPICRAPFEETRNFALESVAVTFQYPCKYKSRGCNMKLLNQHRELHELHCVYAYDKCPFKFLAACNSKEGIVDIITHLHDKHPSFVVETNRQYCRDITNETSTSYWVTTFEKEIFMICCKHSSSGGPIKFNVLHVGMNKSKFKYKFELQFCDQTGSGLKLIISRLCQLFPPNPSIAFKTCLAVPQDILKPFIIRKGVPKVFFKFYIEKL